MCATSRKILPYSRDGDDGVRASTGRRGISSAWLAFGCLIAAAAAAAGREVKADWNRSSRRLRRTGGREEDVRRRARDGRDAMGYKGEDRA